MILFFVVLTLVLLWASCVLIRQWWRGVLAERAEEDHVQARRARFLAGMPPLENERRPR
jgi:hypothetical protein